MLETARDQTFTAEEPIKKGEKTGDFAEKGKWVWERGNLKRE